MLTCTQPYLLFWMGRTLPNMLALFPGADRFIVGNRVLNSVLVNLAISYLIPSSPARAFPTQSRLLTAISLLAFAGVVFRFEVTLLLVPVAIHAIFFVVPPLRVFKTGIISAVVSIGELGHHSNTLDAT